MSNIIVVRNKRHLNIMFMSFILFILFMFYPGFKGEINATYLVIYLLTFLFLVFIHLRSQKDKNWFRLDLLFLLGFSIVHFQWTAMLVLSNIDLNSISYVQYGSVDLRYMNYGTWLSTIGMVCWFIGYAWLPTKNKNDILYIIKYKNLFWVSLVLFVLFVMLAGNSFLSGGIYKGEGGTGAGEGISVYIQLLFSFSILVLTAAVILNSKSDKKLSILSWLFKLDKKYLLLAGAYVLLFLSIGDRGVGMQVAFTFLVIFGSIVKAISLKKFSAIIIVGAIFMTLVGLGRSDDTGENILIAGANKFEFSSSYDITMELANSVRTLYTALDNVPEDHNYFYGKLWLGRLLSVVPFAQSVYLQLSGSNEYELGSAGYITYLKFGTNPPTGEGTTLIADIYLNFGLIGVIFFMFLLGVFFKKLQNELNTQQSFYWIVFAGIFASITFYMGRGSLFDSLRPILWAAVLAILFVRTRKIVK